MSNICACCFSTISKRLSTLSASGAVAPSPRLFGALPPRPPAFAACGAGVGFTPDTGVAGFHAAHAGLGWLAAWRSSLSGTVDSPLARPDPDPSRPKLGCGGCELGWSALDSAPENPAPRQTDKKSIPRPRSCCKRRKACTSRTKKHLVAAVWWKMLERLCRASSWRTASVSKAQPTRREPGSVQAPLRAPVLLFYMETLNHSTKKTIERVAMLGSRTPESKFVLASTLNHFGRWLEVITGSLSSKLLLPLPLCTLEAGSKYGMSGLFGPMCSKGGGVQAVLKLRGTGHWRSGEGPPATQQAQIRYETQNTIEANACNSKSFLPGIWNSVSRIYNLTVTTWG